MDEFDQPPEVLGFWHAGVTVRDMDTALRFFCDGLGLRVLREYENRDRGRELVGVDFESMRVVFLEVPGSPVQLELQEYRGVERHSASAPPQHWGVGHFCLYVEDADAVHDRLHRLGFGTRGPVHAFPANSERAGAKAVYTVSPEGYYVEVYEPSPRERGELGYA